jgi:hypothetical protein
MGRKALQRMRERSSSSWGSAARKVTLERGVGSVAMISKDIMVLGEE